MIELFSTAQQIQDFCQQRQWQFCFIGGLALQRWGEPRVTQDVDLTILTGFGNEDGYIQAFLQQFEARIEQADVFALRNRVLLLKSKTGIGIDIALGALDFEACAVHRASYYTFLPEMCLLTCSAEDLIVYKAFAARPRDWVDIEGILIRQRSTIDWNYVKGQLEPLVTLKEEPEILDKLKKIRSDVGDCRNIEARPV